MSEIEKKETDFDLRAFFNSKKGKEILEQSEKDLREEFMINTGMFSPEEDEAWEFLKMVRRFKLLFPSNWIGVCYVNSCCSYDI